VKLLGRTFSAIRRDGSLGVGAPAPVPDAAAEPPPPPPERDSSMAGGKSRYDHRVEAGHRLLHIDLPDWQVAMIDREAARLGIARVRWIRALIANRLRGDLLFTRADELSLLGLHAEARAMRTELAALRRDLTAEAPPGAGKLIARIEELHAALGRHRAAIRAGLEGNLNYWRGEP